MARVLAAVACALTVAVLCLPGTAKAGTASSAVLANINKQRHARGLPPLREAATLSRSSAAFAKRLMRADRFQHARRIAASSRFTHLGEVLAFQRSWRPDPSWVVRQWLRSPAHRAVILSRAFRYVGTGYSSGRFHGRLATIWVAQAGEP